MTLIFIFKIFLKYNLYIFLNNMALYIKKVISGYMIYKNFLCHFK